MQTPEAIAKKTCVCCGAELSARTQPITPAAEGLRRNHKGSGSRQRVIWLGSLLVWSFITLAATLAVLQIYRIQGSHMGFGESLYMQLCQMMPFALMTPIVFVLVAHYPLGRANWMRVLALYLIGGVIFSVVHVGLRGTTPYGIWDGKARKWQSAAWDKTTHRLHIQWPIFKAMFADEWYDDVIDTYVPILFVAYVVSYYSKLKEREKRTAQLEVQLTKANLQVLKSQLQPHFLFNTMHSISGLMFTDVRAADAMMSRLSELLRMSFEDGAEQVTTLNRELEFVSGYLEIEKMRLGERLAVDLDVSPETLDAEFPHLLLQPLVENAIQHGVAKLSSGGKITISSRQDGQSLKLTISDNGPGCDCPNGSVPKAGIGVRASQERLQTLYGEHQSFTFRVPANGGTEVTIRIPFRQTIDMG